MSSTNDIRYIQELNNEVLLEFDRICSKYNIKYSLGYGTLLGAIRHKGFIPWDDDSDVLMLREEYEKFLKIVSNEIDNDKFEFLSVDTHKYYGNIIPRIVLKNFSNKDDLYKRLKWNVGIQLDIFVLDYTVSNSLKQKIQKFFVQKTETLLLLKYGCFYNNVSTIKKIVYFIVRCFLVIIPRKFIKQYQYYWQTKYNNVKHDTLINFGFIYDDLEYIASSYFNSYDKVNFENHEYLAIKEYDDYLKHYYNNYMELPPIEKRKTHGAINVESNIE